MATSNSSISTLVKVILFFAFVVGIAACIGIIATGTPTNRESALLGVLVTVLSVLASWIITHMYSESQHKSAIIEVQEQHKTNLRTYALKAAEKVNNLSNELNKLSIYLEQELDYTEYHSTEEELHAKEERIESAIHIIKTLKSVNDTSLSDWEGVIGDELDQQRVEREEKEEELKAIIDRVESIIEDQKQGFLGSQKHTESLQSEVDHLKDDLRSALAQLSGTAIPRKALRKISKEAITAQCPGCQSELTYRQRPSSRSFKSIICPQCSRKLISRYSANAGFSLVFREVTAVRYICPTCGEDNDVLLDNFPGSAITTLCKNCAVPQRVIRTVDGVDVRDNGGTPNQSVGGKPSEEVISLVKSKLPQLPWPVGIHKSVAKDLGIPTGLAYRAITELMQRQAFVPHVSGPVITPNQLANAEPSAKPGTEPAPGA